MKGLLMAVCGCALLCSTGAPVAAADGERASTQQERDFYQSSIAPALMVIKLAMPPAPEGWVRESETVIDSASPAVPVEDIAKFHFDYTVKYRRTAGVQEETAKLEAAVAEITKSNNDAAAAELEEWNRKKADAEKAVKKARQRKEIGKERKLKKQLEEINKGIEAAAQERDRKIREETDPLLVRDTTAEIRVTVNDTEADHPDLNSFSRPKAAFALRKDGEREGATGWKTGRTVILYGDWQEMKHNLFRLRGEERSFSSRAQSLRIDINGDRTRADQLLKKTDIRSILDLMK